jgi:tRNA pseudouridine55 synthase
MDGVLVIDKPSGPTSHDVVATVRRSIGVSRVGHTGTLDPLATGVLPLVIGRATRLAQFLSASDKEYVAEIRLGFTSETYDAEGPLTPVGVTQGESVEFAQDHLAPLDAVLAEFRGTYSQMPPPYSAKKVGGTPAYKLARRKKPVELEPVRVTVQALEALAANGDMLRVRLVCSSGFYVRTLAHDIGQRLGCGAYLAGLRRTRAGSFTVSDAVPLAAVEAQGFDRAARLIPIDRLLPELPAVIVGEPGVLRVSHGNTIGSEHLADPDRGAASCDGKEAAPMSGRVRLLDEAGTLLAVADWRPGGVLHPAIVLR